MQIRPQNYESFLLVLDGLDPRRRDVYYFTNNTNVFIVYAFVNGNSVISADTGTKPSTFDADFPHAVALSAGIAFL